MIPARKLPPFNFALRRWLTRVLRRRFHNVYVAGGEHLAALDPTAPVVGCVNHTNWWDGFVLYVLSHRFLPHDIYLAMEETNLRRYRFFTWMGVFGVDLSSRRAALPGLRYALRLLQGYEAQAARIAPKWRRPPFVGRALRLPGEGPVPPARLVWMFVQGKLLPPRLPVEVKAGATFLAAHAGARLLPLALRYEWLVESRPSIFVRVGCPLDAKTPPAALAETLNRLLAETDRTLHPLDPDAYQPLFTPAMSMNRRWDYAVHLFLRRRGVFDKHNG